MLELLASPEVWVAFATLTLLEIVLGIDNVVFVSILTQRLPREQQTRGRQVGLTLAMLMRIGLLLCISWVMGLTANLFEVLGEGISGRDLILLAGGAFLIGKATMEVHEALEGGHQSGARSGSASFTAVIVQIALIDIVFSLDSVITAVGIAEHVPVMIAAIVASMIVMLLAAGAISRFVEEHPTIKILALSFLLLIGVMLIGEGLDLHVPKGYIYFAMAFSLAVEMLNIRIRRARAPIHLHRAMLAPEQPSMGSQSGD